MKAERPAAPATGIRCCWLRSGLDVALKATPAALACQRAAGARAGRI